MTESKPNIYQRINAVMKEVKYIKKGSAGQGTGVLHDDVVAKIRGWMIINGIVPILTEVKEPFNTEHPTAKQQVYQAQYKLDLVNMDDPMDLVSYTQSAHAQDNGDKGPGKLSTYAIKVMYVKAFALESGINDESRADAQDRVEGNLAASGTETKAMIENIKTIDPDKLDNAYKHFEQKTMATKEQIEGQAVTQWQCSEINRMINKTKNA